MISRLNKLYAARAGNGWLLPFVALLAALGVALAFVPRLQPQLEPAQVWLVDFYPPEQNITREYHFTQPVSRAFLPELPTAPATIVFRVQSPAPLPARQLELRFNQQSVAAVEIGNQQRVLRLLLPSPQQAGTQGLSVELRSAGASAPGDNRQLGVLVDSAVVLPLTQRGNNNWLLAAVALMALGGLGTAVAVQRRYSAVSGQRSAVAWCDLAFGLICSTWVALFTHFAWASHALFRTSTYDLGIYDQTLWLLSRGEVPFNTGMGIHILGNHAAVLLYPLSLLYLVAPDVRALLLVQCLAIAFGAVALYLLARGRGAPWLGLAVAVAYLLHPSSQNMALFDFHPDALAGAALLWALWAVEYRRWGVLLLCGLALLAAKENFALTVALLGLWVAIPTTDHGRQTTDGEQGTWYYRPSSFVLRLSSLGTRFRPSSFVLRPSLLVGVVLLVASVGWFLLSTQLMLPTYNGQGTSLHLLERYRQFGDSPGAILRTLLTRPDLVLPLVVQPTTLSYLWQLAAPLGLLCLLAPRYLLLALPALLLNLLSASPPQRTLQFHYGALIVPVLAVAALQALLWVRTQRPRLALVGALVCLLAGLLYSQVAVPLRAPQIAEILQQPSSRGRYYAYLVSLVPPGGSVSAQARLQPHLTHRREAYLFPNPFRQVVFFNPQGQPYAPSVEYILYDTKRADSLYMRGAEKLALLEALRERGLYEEMAELDGVLLLRRTNAALPTSCFGPGWQQEECRTL